MKPEKILELINKMDLNAEEKRFIETLKKEPDADLRGFNSPLVCVEKLRRMAVDEINKTEAKAAGDGERKKAAEQIIKRFSAYVSKTTRPADVATAYRDDIGRTVIGSDYSAIRLVCDVAGLSVAPDLPKMGIDFSWFFEENRTATRDEMPLPSISELKAYIKLKKTESADAAKYYDPGDGFPAYNPKLMEEALILLTDEKAGIYPKARYRSELSAIYLYSGRGEGLVFPVRKKMQAATE